MQKKEKNKVVVEKTKKERKEEAVKTYKANSLFSGIVIFLAVIVLAVISFKPIFKNLNYGLDLKGGFEILYEVKDIDGKTMIGIMISALKEVETDPKVEYVFKDSESGSSRGLMCALEIYNKITEEDIRLLKNVLIF